MATKQELRTLKMGQLFEYPLAGQVVIDGVGADTGEIFNDYENNSAGEYAHAEGQNTLAGGIASHAEGKDTKAEGNYSHASGTGTTAKYDNQFVIGSYNQESADAKFIIGNGESNEAENRQNLLEINDEAIIFNGDKIIMPTVTVETESLSVPGYIVMDEESIRPPKSDDGSQALHPSIKFYVSAGQVEGSTLGAKATAEGLNTTASNEAAHAEGIKTSASAKGAHAEGNETRAQGDYSHAEGGLRTFTNGDPARHTIAKGACSHAEGQGSLASGEASHAEGYSYTYGVASHAEGNSTTGSENDPDSGKCAHSEGWNTQATGHSAHSEGYSFFNDDFEAKQVLASGIGAHAEGWGTQATGKGSHAEGRETVAEGDYSHAEGGWSSIGDDIRPSQAIGACSHAEGGGAIAKGYSSHAEGWSTAWGAYSHAEGASWTGQQYNKDNNITETSHGNYAHAEGYYTRAEGNCSHAGGNSSIVQGLNSFVHGLELKSNANNQFVIGKYNEQKDSPYFIIGNGSQENRSNLLEVDDLGVKYKNQFLSFAQQFNVNNSISTIGRPNSDTSKTRTIWWSEEQDLSETITYNGTTSSTGTWKTVKRHFYMNDTFPYSSSSDAKEIFYLPIPSSGTIRPLTAASRIWYSSGTGTYYTMPYYDIHGAFAMFTFTASQCIANVKGSWGNQGISFEGYIIYQKKI